MSSHSNATEAHAFYYRGVDRGESHAYSGCTLSYDGDTAYSYSTAVARVIPARGHRKAVTEDVGSGLTLVPCHTISSTTARHVSLLRGASPFGVVRVPIPRGGRSITPESVRDGLLEWLAAASKGLDRADGRRQFNDLLEARRALLERGGAAWEKAMGAKAFARYAGMDVAGIAREIHAKRTAEAAKKAKRTRETYRKYLDGKTGAEYLDVVRAVFDHSYGGRLSRMPENERQLLKRRLGAADSSFVWLDGDLVRTSKHVAVPVREARAAMHAWEAGGDMRTLKVGGYRVVKYTGGVVQIGCHSIPRANVLALFEAVIGRPFDPGRAKAGC